MLDSLFFAAAIFDGWIVGVFLANLFQLIFGDNPLARLLKLIVSVAAGIGYSVWVLIVGNSDSDEVSIAGFLILTFAPIAVVLILAIIRYMFNENNDK